VTATDESEPTRALPRLPAPVRHRVVALAAEALGSLPAEEVPTALRAVARFAPARRARAGAAPLATALEGDALFRQRVATRVRTREPDLATAVDAGTPPPAAPALEVAALTYLLRPAGWADRLDQLVDDVRHAAASGERAEQDRRLAAQVARADEATVAARQAADAARAELAEVRRETAELRRRIRELEADVGRSRAAEAETRRARDTAAAAAETASATAAAEVRRLRSRLAETEDALESARRAVREGRAEADVRARLLLDTLVGAAQGLRQELALPPATTRPADQVAATNAAPGAAVGPGAADVPVRALAADDPALLDQLLALPQVHLVVDGYNVTRTGYGDLPLVVQRSRLLTGLAALAARTGAEVTCVFDGATLEGPVPSAAPRGVRVLFSPAGVTADEVVRRLVRAEPPGRPVVVVSSDREVADGVARAGARPVASSALLRRLDRG
jgi:predicted RNA-binding protein with PIN domain